MPESRPHITIICHTDFSESNPNNPMLPFRTDSPETWDRIFDDLGRRANVDSIAIGCRGTFDPPAVACLPLVRAAYLRASHHPSLTFWGDTVGLPDIAHERSGGGGFDFLNPQHIQWALDDFFGHFFRNFGDLHLFRIDGKVVMPLWGIRSDTGWGFTNQHAAQRLLDAVDAKWGARFIVDKTWLEYAPNLNVYGVHDWFDPWSTPPNSFTTRTHNGVTTGVVVPGFANPTDGAEKIPHSGETARRGLKACEAAGCHIIVLEGATDFPEKAYWIRNAEGDDSKLKAIREITGDEDMSAAGTTPLFTFDHRAVIHNADGTKSLRWNQAEKRTDHTVDRVFSLQPDGSFEDRPLAAIGPWEKGTPDDHFLVFRVEDARAVFPWQD